jgi:uncharacterized protein
MSLSKIIIGVIFTVGLITVGAVIYGQNYLVKEVSNLKVEVPAQKLSYYEKKDVPNLETEVVDANDQEIEIMMSKLASGRDMLDKFWRSEFAGEKIRYTSPKVVAFTNGVNSPCGVIGEGNAAYCGRNHTIYFDVNFFARMMRMTGANLDSDGDMAVIAILAHEWGHAVQAQTKISGKVPMYNELQADCLSGAFARYAAQQGVLEEGDTQEAAFAFAVGGDNAPWYSVDAHGNSEMRVGSFKVGFQNGMEACR